MAPRPAFLLGLLLAFAAGRSAMAQDAPAAASAVQAPPAESFPAAAIPPPVPQAPVVITPEDLVAATPPAEDDAQAVTAVVNPPLPLKRPVISKMTIPARALFSQKKLPSTGKPRAIGYYPRGCLQGAVELPIDGPNWQVMRLSRNRNWGHPELVEFLERFAPAAAKATGWPGILVGDMAQPRGGPLPYGHMSHQIGLDVDIWFMPMPAHRLSRHERDSLSASNLVAADWKHVNPKTWSAADAAFIRTAAEQPNVERVLVNAAIKKHLCEMQGKKHPNWMDKVRPWYGHHDHIHVRLKCPADSPHCRPQPAVPGTDGCDALSYWFSDRVLHPKPKKHGKPKKPITLADLPRACKTVLDAPAKKIDVSAGGK
jgi:penicillin-insensitive murein endopeptidase